MMLILLTGMLHSVFANADKGISVEEAIKKKIITATIKGKGGHLGDVIKIKIKNLQSKSINIAVEAGRKLDSENESKQDILINKAVTLALLPNQTKTFTLSGMCCQAHNSSPDTSSVFKVGKMADTSLVKLSQFIDLNKWYANSIAQNAIWVISDDKPMEDIGGNDEVSKKLQVFVSELTGKEMPKYKIDYASDPNGTSAHSGVPAKIRGKFDYEIYSNGLVTFGVYDSQGHVVQMFFTDVPRNKGSYEFSYEFNTSNLPKGDYYARFRFDGQVRKEQKFAF